MVTIAVDLDDTLIRSTDDSYEVVEGAAEAMRNLRARGYRVVIHTCRITEAIEQNMLVRTVEFIKDLLNQFNIEFDEIYVGEKMIADIYVDDRAIGFEGQWLETEQRILRRLSARHKKSA